MINDTSVANEAFLDQIDAVRQDLQAGRVSLEDYQHLTDTLREHGEAQLEMLTDDLETSGDHIDSAQEAVTATTEAVKAEDVDLALERTHEVQDRMHDIDRGQLETHVAIDQDLIDLGREILDVREAYGTDQDIIDAERAVFDDAEAHLEDRLESFDHDAALDHAAIDADFAQAQAEDAAADAYDDGAGG